jgi:hypothetical protein
MPRRDLAHTVEKCGLIVFRQKRQEVGQASQIHGPVDLLKTVKAFGHRCEGEKTIPGMKVKRLLPEKVPRKEQALPLPVPKREREVSTQPGDCALFPGRQGMEEKVRIGACGSFDCTQAKRSSDIRSIVQPNIRCEGSASLFIYDNGDASIRKGASVEQLCPDRDARSARNRTARIRVHLLRGKHGLAFSKTAIAASEVPPSS